MSLTAGDWTWSADTTLSPRPRSLLCHPGFGGGYKPLYKTTIQTYTVTPLNCTSGGGGGGISRAPPTFSTFFLLIYYGLRTIVFFAGGDFGPLLPPPPPTFTNPGSAVVIPTKSDKDDYFCTISITFHYFPFKIIMPSDHKK